MEEPPDAAVVEKQEESSGASPSISKAEQHAPAPVETADPSILLYISYFVLRVIVLHGQWLNVWIQKIVSKNTSNQIT